MKTRLLKRRKRRLFRHLPAFHCFAATSYQLAYIYARAGNVRQAHHVLTELEKSPGQRNDQAYMHTLAYVALGDRDRAFALMERLYETHNIDLLALKNDPALDELRGDARFQSLLRRFGLT